MDVSVVVPMLDERENVAPVHAELCAVLDQLAVEYEIFLVDDGSTDGTFDEIEGCCKAHPGTVGIKLSRNFGQTAAFAAGIGRSCGDDLILMDGDGQNDPGEIPRMLAKRAEGFDLVAGWRADRKDAWWTRVLPSRIANRLIGWITGVRLHDYGCSLKVLRGDLARGLKLYGEMHRFVPALVDDLGGRIAEVRVNHRARTAGRSKYGLGRFVRVLLDLVTVKFLSSYSTRPIHAFGVLGALSTAIGLVIVAWLGIERVVFGNPIGDRPMVLLGILLTVMGLQFITMGLLGELLVRTYHESQDKPVFRVDRVIGE